MLIIIHVWNINIEGPIFVFFQNFTRNRPNFKIPRSSSMRTPSPPGGSSGMLSPGQTKPLGVSSTPGSFQVSTQCSAVQCTEAGFTNFLSIGFIVTAIVSFVVVYGTILLL